MREKGFEIEKLSENTKAKQNQDENFRQDKTKISCFQRSQAVLSKMFSCKEYLWVWFTYLVIFHTREAGRDQNNYK